MFLLKDENSEGTVSVSDLLEIMSALGIAKDPELSYLKEVVAYYNKEKTVGGRTGRIPYTDWLKKTSVRYMLTLQTFSSESDHPAEYVVSEVISMLSLEPKMYNAQNR